MVQIVYKTTNLVNGKIYIGVHSTDTPDKFDGYLGSNTPLRRAIKKNGKENFTRETLFVFEDRDEAYAKEAELVDTEFVKRDDTYNICGGGYGAGSGENHPSFGLKHTEETKKLMRENQWDRNGENNPMWNKHHSDSVKKAQSVRRRGKKHTEETKKLMRENRKDTRGENNPMWNKHHSEETKQLMRDALLGLKRSDAIRQKISEAQKGEKNHNFGKPTPVETRRKQSIAFLGEQVFYQRLKDIAEIEKVRGWKAKLGRHWGVSPRAGYQFIERWYKE